jgi:hypothetical protein
VTIQRADLEVVPPATWADRVAEALAGRFRSDPELCVCLPTGSTPLPVYARLPDVLEAGGISVGRASVVGAERSSTGSTRRRRASLPSTSTATTRLRPASPSTPRSTRWADWTSCSWVSA